MSGYMDLAENTRVNIRIPPFRNGLSVAFLGNKTKRPSIYFDNDQYGYAVENATQLMAMTMR